MGIWDTAETPQDGAADPRGSGRGRFAAGTPDDVAALYTWANLQGARYRDFSASRKRYREQIRAQATEPGSDPVLRPEEPKVAAAVQPESGTLSVPGSNSLEDRSKGGSAVRWAAAQRGWDSSSRALNREDFVPRHAPVETFGAEAFNQPAVAAKTASQAFEPRRPEQSREALPGRDPDKAMVPGVARLRDSMWEIGGVESDPLYEGAGNLWAEDRWERVTPSAGRNPGADVRKVSGAVAIWEPEMEQEQEVDRPAWLSGAQWETKTVRPAPAARVEAHLAEEPPPRVATRWSALRDVMESSSAVERETPAAIPVGRRAPLLVVFSLAGGVGRTSLLATLGRALSASGERVVLGDAAPYSLLPFYFGARDLRPGEMRAFAPPEGSEDSPIFLVNYDVSRTGSDASEQKHMVGEILRDGAECHRILLDLPAGSEWLLRRLATLQPTVLVPLMPDMTSVISLEAVERYFAGLVDAEGIPVQPFYLLNQFDGSMALHLDVRELLRRRLGERLLNFVIRRSGAVSEAMAEGMTVADYAPESPVTRDYFDVAAWLRTMSPPAMAGGRGVRSGRG